MSSQDRFNCIEPFEQVVFTESLFTGSVIHFGEIDGGECLRLSVFGQGDKHPQVKLQRILESCDREIARGYLLGSFVTIQDEACLEFGRIVQGTALALECNNQIMEIPLPNVKIRLEVPSKLPLL